MRDDNTFGIIVVVCLILWAILPASEIQEKSIYLTYCQDFQHNSFSCPDKLGVMKMTWKVFPQEQLVVGKNLGDLIPCKVFDKDNWECQADGNVQSMHNGDYRESADLNAGSLDDKGNKSIIPRYLQISSLEYYIRSTINFFGIFF